MRGVDINVVNGYTIDMTTSYDWHTDPELGKVPDRVIADRGSVHPDTVKKHRQRKGIHALCASTARVWDAPWCSDSDIGKVPDRVIAERYSVDVQDVLSYRNANGIRRTRLSDMDLPWGEKTDAEIAEMTGRTVGYVRGIRKSLGHSSPLSFSDGVDWENVGLGERQDSVIAGELGVGVDTIRSRRRTFGIPLWSPPARDCEVCGLEFRSQRQSKTTCSRSCREKITGANRRGSGVSPGRRYEVLSRDGFTCQYCGESSDSGARLHVDHICPRDAGGADEHENLATACDGCNLGKGARDATPPPSMVTESDYGMDATVLRDILSGLLRN